MFTQEELIRLADFEPVTDKLPWATHGFDYIQRGPGGQLANFTIQHFLNYVTK